MMWESRRERKVNNNVALVQWHAEVTGWEIKHDQAKANHRGPMWMKLKRRICARGRPKSMKRLRHCVECELEDNGQGGQDIGRDDGLSRED